MSPALDQELRGLRRARRLSLGMAAALADLPKSTLAAWENGVSRPRGPALARFLDAMESEPRIRARLLHAADPTFARIELVHSPLGAPVDVGTVLRAMRMRRRTTQADLARRVGVTQSAVARWETGDAVPSPETIHAVGFALGATVEETLALASVQGGGDMGLSDDPERALGQINPLGPGAGFRALREVVSLGQESELWARASRDPKWDVCLIAVLALRADWLVGQNRFDEIAAPARRAVAMARTTEERRQAAPAVAALADYDRHRGAGHRASAELAGLWAECLPEDRYHAWMLAQRGLCLARMGADEEGTRLVGAAAEIDILVARPGHIEDPWSYRAASKCASYLAAGEPAKAAAVVGGRRERHFPTATYVQIEHANGRAVTDADMDFLRFYVRREWANVQGYQRLARMERRQAKLAGGEPVSFAPGPIDDATRDRLWAAVLRDHPG